MKIFKDLRMQPFALLNGWNSLSVETRRRFAREIGSDLQVNPDLFNLAELRRAGFMSPHKQSLNLEIRPFRNWICSMYRHRHFDTDGEKLSANYVSDYLTSWECSRLPNVQGFRFGRKAADIAKEVVESSWLKAFQQCESREEWELQENIHDIRFFCDESFELVQRWIQRQLKEKNPLPIEDFLNEIGANTALATDALRAAIRYMLLFPALKEDSMEIVLGIWPGIYARMTRPKAEAPKIKALPNGFKIYNTPMLLHDMTAILVAASGEGLRLKSNEYDLYKKAEDRLFASLTVPQPPPNSGYQPPFSGRINQARRWLERMKFLSIRGKKGNKHLVPSEKGRSWISGTETERLQAIHDVLVKTREKRARKEWFYGDQDSYLPHNPQTQLKPESVNLEDRVAETFNQYQTGEWIELKPFLQWQSQSENPFLLNMDQTIERIFSGPWSQNDSFREEQWKKLLNDFLYERLLMLGGAKIASNTQGDIRFSITPTGKYLLGETDQFTYESPVAEGTILVQPNFEIIFTAPDPGAESSLLRFADRIGNVIGALFRITKGSIQHALNSGINEQTILNELNALASVPIPQNVQKQIEDWSRAFRKVSFKRAILIECPDTETVMQVKALFPKKVSLLGDQLLRVEGNEKGIMLMKKKLRDNGIGIE